MTTPPLEEKKAGCCTLPRKEKVLVRGGVNMQNTAEVSLLSDSDIGSPFAFSTAIKRSSPKHSQSAAR